MFNRKKEFEKDNDWGKFGEMEMSIYLPTILKTENKTISYWYSNDAKSKSQLKQWDLRFGVYEIGKLDPIDRFEVEVKTDGYEINTSNLIFEKSCSKKKSGVFATTARYFVYFLPLFTKDNVYIIPSQKLAKLLTKSFSECIVYGGDEGSNTSMYKINRSDFNDRFIESGGKILTHTNYTISERFNKKQFRDDKYVYYGDKISDNFTDFDTLFDK